MKKAGTPEFQLLHLSNPVFAWLEITYACPGTCPGCSSSSAVDRAPEMSACEWKEIIKGLSPFLAEARLTGGEPTLFPELPLILEALEKEKLPFKIYTNGLWPDPEGLLKTLRKSPHFRGFVFSLHGSSEPVHSAFSGLGEFDRIVSHIQQAAKSGLAVYTSTVLGEFNRNDMPGIIKLVSMCGSRRHYFRRYVGPYRAGISLYREAQRSLLEALGGIPRGIFSYRVGECFPRCFYPTGSSCLAGLTHITIDPSGSIRACPFSEETLGSWQSGMDSWKKNVLKWGSDLPRQCLRCDEIERCMGGCRAMRRNHKFKRDPLMDEPVRSGRSIEPFLGQKPLFVDGCLKQCCTARKEEFGWLLIADDEVIPVTDAGGELITLCDGSRGMEEIEKRAGSEAKMFLISLVRRGFIEFV